MRDFRLWWLALLGMGISLQMIELVIGWEVYALHRSALDLGWIGLAEFVPLFVLALPAGQLADRVPRRLIFAASLLFAACISVGLALVSGSGARRGELGAFMHAVFRRGAERFERAELGVEPA